MMYRGVEGLPWPPQQRLIDCMSVVDPFPSDGDCAGKADDTCCDQRRSWTALVLALPKNQVSAYVEEHRRLTRLTMASVLLLLFVFVFVCLCFV